MPRSATLGDWIGLLCLTLLWGTSFALNEIALASYSPAMLVGGRVIVAAGVLYAFMRANGVSLPTSFRGWLPMALMAVLGNVLPFRLVASAQQSIDSSVAGVLMAVMPLFVLTLAHFFIPGSRLTFFRGLGFVMGFVGVVFVIGPESISSVGGDAALWGALAVLLAALSYSINTIYARRLGASNPLQLAAGMMLVASALSLPQIATDLPDLGTPSVAATIAMLVLGLLSTGFATVLYFRIIQGPGPTFLSLVNYLVPAWAVLTGALFLDEDLSTGIYIGMALILSGIAISEIGPRIRRALQARDSRQRASLLSRAATEEA